MSEKKRTKKQAEEIFESKPLDDKAKIKNTAFSFEVTVDTTPQALRKIRPYHHMKLDIPSLLPLEGQVVMMTLFLCFSKAGGVSEGLIGDLLWGFEQPTVDERTGKPRIIPRQVTWEGLRQLESYGYVRFQAKDNSYINLESDAITSAFVRYEPKLLSLIYEGPAA